MLVVSDAVATDLNKEVKDPIGFPYRTCKTKHEKKHKKEERKARRDVGEGGKKGKEGEKGSTGDRKGDRVQRRK